MPGTFETSCIARLLETSTVATSTFLTSQSQDKACWDSAKDQLQVRTASGCHQQTSPFLSVDLFGLHDLHVLPSSRVSCECGTSNSNTSKPWTYHILPFETTINHNMYHMTVCYGLPRFTSISPSETFRPQSCQVAFQGFAKDFGDGINPWIRFLIHHGGQILPVFLQLRELVRGALMGLQWRTEGLEFDQGSWSFAPNSTRNDPIGRLRTLLWQLGLQLDARNITIHFTTAEITSSVVFGRQWKIDIIW